MHNSLSWKLNVLFVDHFFRIMTIMALNFTTKKKLIKSTYFVILICSNYTLAQHQLVIYFAWYPSHQYIQHSSIYSPAAAIVSISSYNFNCCYLCYILSILLQLPWITRSGIVNVRVLWRIGRGNSSLNNLLHWRVCWVQGKFL